MKKYLTFKNNKNAQKLDCALLEKIVMFHKYVT